MSFIKTRDFDGSRPDARVGSGGFQILSGRVGWGQEVFEIS